MSIKRPDRDYSRFIRTIQIGGRQTYVIADYNFWTDNQEEIDRWLIENTERGLKTQEGMTISFANEQEEIMFLLKWGGK